MLSSWRLWLALCGILVSGAASAQDASTGAIHGTVADTSEARIVNAQVTVTNNATGTVRTTVTTDEGTFVVQMLPPGEYTVKVEAAGMESQQTTGVALDVGATVDLQFTLAIQTAQVSVTVMGGTPLVETQPSAISSVIEEHAIAELPLNGRRFSDLALLTPGVTQDPRGLTSTSNGDLAFGGVQGYQTSFLVDGSDSNNGYFSQARGRYRAPYQFSNEVIQEFRVSSNTYGTELGRSGGAVINVVTKSGTNHAHGSAFYYLRDSTFNAQPAFSINKPRDRQQQFGATIGGPIRKNRLFYYLGFDQHWFDVPTIVRFRNGSTTVTPQYNAADVSKTDYEICDPRIGGPACDQAKVFSAAQQLSKMGGDFRSKLLGNAALAKLDWTISPRHQLATRVSTSRYYGENNVYFDPSSPVTYYATSDNGEEDVSTESVAVSLTSALSFRTTSHLRVQFSRDLQQSTPNDGTTLQEIYNTIDGFGRASILPRETREHRLQIAQTFGFNSGRHDWKFGGDALLTWTRNFFPMLYGGEYIFDTIKVNQFTFQPPGELQLTPLRAYAHEVPRYYLQNFGNAVSHPDTNEYAWFAQDTVRVTNHLAVSLGLRYDLQTFRTDGLISNPLWPASGKLPNDTNNFAPRAAFAYSLGQKRPLVVRGGWGMFYTRIPQIYASAVATNNGLTNSYLFLDNRLNYSVFPAYPSPLVACPPQATTCAPPPSVANQLTSEVSAFAPNFQTPYVEQASLGVEKEVAHRFAVSVNYLYVHGVHLIRARDANLPPPANRTYPVYDDSGALLGYYDVASFANWQATRGFGCPYAPCVSDVIRPIPQLGPVTQFESAASSVYHGLTFSARRRLTRGLFFRLAYTWAHAIDNGQDSLTTAASLVQNAYSTGAEHASSTTDQRQRLVFSWIAAPQPFHRDHPVLQRIFNNWKWSGILTIGSGRPVNALILNDANGDGNWSNDRLPGVSRNAFTGPDYATTDMRITRRLQLTDRLRMELFVEAFNLFNRDNQRPDVNNGGFVTTAGEFVSYSTTAGGKRYPAYYRLSGSFLQPTSSYAPRQVQIAARFHF